MRVLYFTRAWTEHDRRFARAFAARRIELGVLSLRPEPHTGLPTDFVKDLGALSMVAEESGLDPTSMVTRFTQREHAFAPDVTLAGPLGDCAAIVHAAATGTPWVAQSWAFDVYWEYEQNPQIGANTVKVLRNCPALFADADAVVARVVAIAGRLPEARFVMPWGLELMGSPSAASRTYWRAKLALRENKTFLHVRGFDAVYAPEILLRAWQQVIRNQPTARLLLVGDGFEQSPCRRLVDQLDLTESVSSLGRMSHADLLELYHAVDYYVSCAASDGTSISLLEALWAGLPAVVCDVGGNAEWVTSGRNGMLTTFGEPAALAEGLCRVQELSRASVLAWNRVLLAEKADWERNFGGFVAFLKAQSGSKSGQN